MTHEEAIKIINEGIETENCPANLCYYAETGCADCEWRLALFKAIEALKNQNNCKDCAGCTQWLCDCSNVKAEIVDRIVEQLEDTAKSYQEYYPEDYIFEVSDMIELCEEVIDIVKGVQNG